MGTKLLLGILLSILPKNLQNSIDHWLVVTGTTKYGVHPSKKEWYLLGYNENFGSKPPKRRFPLKINGVYYVTKHYCPSCLYESSKKEKGDCPQCKNPLKRKKVPEQKEV